MKPAAREREAVAERIASIILNVQPDPFQDPVQQCAKEIMPVLLAAERAAAERQRKRDSGWLLAKSRGMEESPVAALAVNMCGMAILGVPLEDPDAD